MIIHTLSKKSPHMFGVIVDYLAAGRAESDPARGFNLWASPEDPEAVKQEFLRNYAQHHCKQRGRVVLMHEIISPDPEDAEKVTPEMLHDIAEKYLEARAPEAMGYLVYHEKLDQNNRPQPHVHILLSGNKISSKRSIRLSKEQYGEVRQNVARYAYEKYGLSQAYEQENEGQKKEFTKEKVKRVQREVQRGKRDKSLSKKEQVETVFRTLFSGAGDKALFDQAMREAGFAWNRTGKNPSVIDIASGKKYRLKTLGMVEDYERRSQEWEKDAQRLQERRERAERMYEAYQEEARTQEAGRESSQTQEEKQDRVSEEFRKEAERISQISPEDRSEYEKRRLQTWLMLQHLEEQRGQEREQSTVHRIQVSHGQRRD